MPPSVKLSSKAFSTQLRRRYVCPSCLYNGSFVNGVKLKKPRYRLPTSGRRAASIVTPVTAVNAKKEINPAFQDVYHAVNVFKKDAAVYSNLAQIQLALLGLESENAVTRIAVYGGDDKSKTRRLVKVLLADPLAPEAPWEKHLLNLDESDGRTLILRYAEQFDVDQRHPLVRTLSLPSRVLQNHKLEILIKAAGGKTEGDSGTHMYLSPGLETPASATGRFSTIIYPVHKALILARDGEEPQSKQRDVSGFEEDMIISVVDTPWNGLSAPQEPLRPTKAINLEKAEEAIATIRQSLDNSFDYEHIWFDSGLPRISSWLTQGTESLPTLLKPTIRRLIETVAADAERAIDNEEFNQLQIQASAVVSTATRTTLDTFLTNWAEAAHTELRDELDFAFTSRQWRKLAWWKLFWRVDDVTYIFSDVLQRSWLVDADRGIIYLAGRIEQAGLLPPSRASTPPTNDGLPPMEDPASNPYHTSPSSNSQPDPSNRPYGTVPPFPYLSDMISPNDKDPVTSTTHSLSLSLFPIPSIAHHRQHLLTTIPPVTSLSQRLLLSALSTTILLSTFSILIFVSTISTTVLEAGAIAATGAVWALRKMQKKWEGAKDDWMGVVREEGRKALKGVEDGWRGTIREGGMGEGVDDGREEERRRARMAVEGLRTTVAEGKMDEVGRDTA
ncbi:MAG: hypothetical protein Q9220_005533 [cf. Caloplaca sp. 1 TL-2023]